MKCLPNHDQIYFYDGALASKSWHLPSASIRIKSCSDFQHLLKGVQKRGHSSLNFSEMKHCVLGETGRAVLQTVKYLQEPILWIQPLYLLISRKALKTIHGDICFSRLAITFMRLAETCKKKKNVLDCMYSLFTKITYILTFPSVPLEQYRRAILNVVSLAIVLILPQVKLNLQLSFCATF